MHLTETIIFKYPYAKTDILFISQSDHAFGKVVKRSQVLDSRFPFSRISFLPALTNSLYYPINDG